LRRRRPTSCLAIHASGLAHKVDDQPVGSTRRRMHRI
jgi:hypothetical protein